MNKESNSRILRKMVAAIFALALTSALFFVGTSNAEASSYPTAPRVTGSGTEMVSTWDCVYFGNYPQEQAEATPKQPIKWRVLSVSGNNAFLLADKNLDYRAYNQSFRDMTWKDCTIRSWLNGYDGTNNLDGINYEEDNFIDSAFSIEEQEKIIDTNVINQDNPKFGTPGGDNTTDKIFLISLMEATNNSYGFPNEINPSRDEEYTASKTRNSINTIYTNEKWEKKEIPTADWWWLRTPGYTNETYGKRYTAFVYFGGGINFSGNNINIWTYGIRPALHLNLNSTDLTNAGTLNSEGAETLPVEITVSSSTGGMASGGGSHYYDADASVTAAANAGYRFTHWTENGIVVSTLNPYVFDAVANRALTANFKKTATIAVSAGTGGAVMGGNTYDIDSKVTLTATPNNGYRFVNWTESGKAVSTSYQHTFNATVDRSLMANFAKIGTATASVKALSNKSKKGRLKVSWNTVTGANKYEIFRSTRASRGFSKIKTVSATTKTFTDSKLKRNKKYYYKIKVVCKAGTVITKGGYSKVKNRKTKK